MSIFLRRPWPEVGPSVTTIHVSATPLPAKKDVARALLLRGSVFIHLDPRRSGVLVPARLRSQAQVVLQVGLDMPVPIPDLRIDHEGVFGTLSFKGVPFACFVPWGAIFALVGEDAKGMVWHADMPLEIAAEVERESRRRVGAGGTAELVGLDAVRAARMGMSRPDIGRMDFRRSGAVPKRKSDRPPAWDRPAYLRVVK